MPVSLSLFSGLSSVSTVPAGSLLNASFVGANTVKGPGDSSVGTSPAAFTAATSVVWSFELTAFCTMVFDGYIAAPPTILVISSAKVGMAASEPRPSASAAAVANTAVRIRVMGQLRLLCLMSRRGDVRSYGAATDADAGPDQRFSSAPEAITGPVG